MVGPILIFLVVYAMIASEKMEKSVAAVLGAVAVLACGYISFEDAAKAVDLNVIFLLIGMMTCVSILAETGFFEWVALASAKISKGNAFVIFIILMLITMVFSAFLDNVTTVILLVPVVILVSQLLDLPVKPLIILMAVASNIGGAATLIGDPPNIVIGSKANLPFNDFLIHLAPCILVEGAVFIGISLFILRNKLHVPQHVKMRVLNSHPELALVDKKKMWISLAVFAVIFTCFVLHSVLHLEAGVIALGGMAVMLLLCKVHSDKVLKAIEWDVIMFFIGLFIIIGALEHRGVLHELANWLISLCRKDLFLACMVILWSSAVFSAILDNIPFVIAMTPLVQQMLRDMDMPDTGANPLFWALALGACLGGNATIIGASANVVSCKLGERNGYKITFAQFMRWGIPLTIVQIIIAMVYLYLRYFWAK
jgi:Na+/H+ antiporter NhaD/arsenite permease-like protein